MFNRSDIFTRAHQLTREYKQLGGLGSYRDIFAQSLRTAYEEARKAEVAAYRDHLKKLWADLHNTLLNIDKEWDEAAARNDYAKIAAAKEAREIHRIHIREVARELAALEGARRKFFWHPKTESCKVGL